MRFLVILAALALAGCATTQTMPKEVKVPVPVPCKIDAPAKPVLVAASLSADANIYDQVKAILADRLAMVAYQGQLEAAITACQ